MGEKFLREDNGEWTYNGLSDCKIISKCVNCNAVRLQVLKNASVIHPTCDKCRVNNEHKET